MQNISQKLSYKLKSNNSDYQSFSTSMNLEELNSEIFYSDDSVNKDYLNEDNIDNNIDDIDNALLFNDLYDEDEINNESNSCDYDTFTIITIIVFFISVIIVYFFKGSVNSLNELELLKNKLPDQHNITLKTIVIALKPFLTETEFKKPSVLIFAVNDSLAKVEFLKGKISDILKSKNIIKSDHCVRITLESSEIDFIKETILSVIKNAHEKGNYCVDFGNLFDFPSEIVPFLHGLCDDENAPFKKMIYFITIKTDPKRLKSVNKLSDLKFNEEIIFKMVNDMWAFDVDSTRIDALLARISNNIVVVN